jgi:hypothetical protein
MTRSGLTARQSGYAKTPVCWSMRLPEESLRYSTGLPALSALLYPEEPLDAGVVVYSELHR